MSPELQKQLADLLGKLSDATTSGAAWAAAQAGPLVHEKIVYGRVAETVQLALALGGLFVFVRLTCFCVAVLRKGEYHDEVGYVLGGLATAIGAVVMAVFAVAQIQAVCLAWLAPRLYVVEWLRDFIKG